MLDMDPPRLLGQLLIGLAAGQPRRGALQPSVVGPVSRISVAIVHTVSVCRSEGSRPDSSDHMVLIVSDWHPPLLQSR
jgi:hypothetical protein